MSETKMYSLGNQPEEYELVDKYVGWIPKGFSNWDPLRFSDSEEKSDGIPCTLVNTETQECVNLTLHTFISKSAFPFRIYGEDRADNWWHFCLVSTIDEPDRVFIIPLH